MPKIESIKCRRILNSHVEFTNEFIIELADGSSGIGGSPQGETISIYEDDNVTTDPSKILQAIDHDGFIGNEINQEKFDSYLNQQIPNFGRNNVYGLSLAFFNAISECNQNSDIVDLDTNSMVSPFICFNILNGGWHAYTNPVLSDFHEYIFVTNISNLYDAVACHNEIQQVVREKLINLEKTSISGNVVHRFSTTDNRECIDFLLKICESLGVSDKFELMIDSSSGDLWNGKEYHLSITNNALYSREEFLEYWIDIINQYDLRFIEDPFHERDMENWRGLTNSQESCKVIGDNFYSSEPTRIAEGAQKKYTHGVIVKPNQAGTVTAVQKAIDVAQLNNQFVITSHRSISTESTFISLLTCSNNVKYIKIGPLMTDYSAVMRLNEILRLTEEPACK